ncbi:unnamed protein product [Pseudo-nitzschia multistriata]|uniref:Glycosyl transferase 64 domain-containing protein n=1 Tax=Pseudo-nitzschia multistriata TaxID=183589 RepID=A0A448Z665_9STRA|nr:unnamed protein product [Pseudo-nitzschia multistriata]
MIAYRKHLLARNRGHTGEKITLQPPTPGDAKGKHTRTAGLSSCVRRLAMKFRFYSNKTMFSIKTIALVVLALVCVGIWDRFFYRTGCVRLGGDQPWLPSLSSPLLPPPHPSTFAVVINTYRRPERLRKTVRHYAETCGRRYGVGRVFVVWADQHIEPPTDDFFWGTGGPPLRALQGYNNGDDTATGSDANRVPVEVLKKHKNSLNVRFEPIPQLQTRAGTTSVFMVDDDVRVACPSLVEAFSVWRENPDTMVGFYPRLALPPIRKHDTNPYDAPAGHGDLLYHLWPKVYLAQKFNIILTKASFLHSRYLELYTSDDSFPREIKDYVDEHMNCEDIAMSVLVANYTNQYRTTSKDHTDGSTQNPSRPVLYVEGSVSDVGMFGGISSGPGHFATRTNCLNEITSIVRARGWGSPLERDFDLVENSCGQHSPGFWWQSAPSNSLEWLGLVNVLS